MKHTLLATALLVASLTAYAAGPTVHAEQRLATDTALLDRTDAASAPVRSDDWAEIQGRERRRDGRGVGAVLYANSDFRGDRYVVEGDYMRDLVNTGFNDRAQSLRVERGYWMFCSDADFQGTCRTFGPGEYPVCPADSNNRISSGRRISKTIPIRAARTGSGETRQDRCRSSTTSRGCAASWRARARSPSSACRPSGIGRATSRPSTCRTTATA